MKNIAVLRIGSAAIVGGVLGGLVYAIFFVFVPAMNVYSRHPNYSDPRDLLGLTLFFSCIFGFVWGLIIAITALGARGLARLLCWRNGAVALAVSVGSLLGTSLGFYVLLDNSGLSGILYISIVGTVASVGLGLVSFGTDFIRTREGRN